MNAENVGLIGAADEGHCRKATDGYPRRSDVRGIAMNCLLLATMTLSWIGSCACGAEGASPGDATTIENSLGMQMIHVAAGSFAMGFHSHGPAQTWDRAGQPVSSVIFQKGRMTR